MNNDVGPVVLAAPPGTNGHIRAALDWDTFEEWIQAAQTLGLSYRATSEMVRKDWVMATYPDLTMQLQYRPSSEDGSSVRLFRLVFWGDA